MRDHPLVRDVSTADRICRLLDRNTQAQPAGAHSAQPDHELAAQPGVQKGDGGTASSSSSCASAPHLFDSKDVALPVNIFKHLTGLEHLRELQVCCLATQSFRSV